MASTFVEASPGLNQLFRDISLMFSPAESKDVVQSAKRIYGKQFYSLGDQDILIIIASTLCIGLSSTSSYSTTRFSCGSAGALPFLPEGLVFTALESLLHTVVLY